MTEIDEYGYILVYRLSEALPMPGGFCRQNDFLSAISKKAEEGLAKYDAHHFVDIEKISDKIFIDLTEGRAFEVSRDKFAGEYLRFRPDTYKKIREKTLNDSGINTNASKIGNKFFVDVFSAYVASFTDAGNGGVRPPYADVGYFEDEFVAEVIPAANRMVPLNHNTPEYQQINSGLAEVYEAFRGANDLEIDPNERNRILCSLNAARELWKAAELTALQIKVGVILSLESVKPFAGDLVKTVSIQAIIAAIKSFVKNATGVDLDGIL